MFLMENNTLMVLEISWNKIGDDGMKLIAEGLQDNNTLIKLIARECTFTEEGS